MRVTRNKEPRVCGLCGHTLVVGGLGVNYPAGNAIIRRGHPGCVMRWKKAERKRLEDTR